MHTAAHVCVVVLPRFSGRFQKIRLTAPRSQPGQVAIDEPAVLSEAFGLRPPAQAKGSGLRVNWLHYGLLAVISLAVVATFSTTGLILAIGLLIAPGAIAFLLVREFRTMLWVVSVVCVFSMLAGTYAGFFLDSAPAPTIILILTAIFIAAFLRRQTLTRRASRKRIATHKQPAE